MTGQVNGKTTNPDPSQPLDITKKSTVTQIIS
jgi:hypothetical protein